LDDAIIEVYLYTKIVELIFVFVNDDFVIDWVEALAAGLELLTWAEHNPVRIIFREDHRRAFSTQVIHFGMPTRTEDLVHALNLTY